MIQPRIILYRRRDWSQNDNVPWFCAYAKYAKIGSNPFYEAASKYSFNVALHFADVENITIDFSKDFIQPLKRSCALQEQKLICDLSHPIITKIESLTGKVLVSFRSKKSIDLGSGPLLNRSVFASCESITFHSEHWQTMEYYFTLHNVINIDALVKQISSFFQDFEVKENKIICKRFSKDSESIIHKIEPYIAPDLYPGFRSFNLEIINKISFDDENVLTLQYIPTGWNYKGSFGKDGPGHKNMHRYEREISYWKRKFPNLQELNEFVLSLNLAESVTDNTWNNLIVKGGEEGKEIDFYIEDNR